MPYCTVAIRIPLDDAIAIGTPEEGFRLAGEQVKAELPKR
jgi:hypothetical protein